MQFGQKISKLRQCAVYAVALLFVGFLSSVAQTIEGPFFDDKDTVAAVQQALAKFGYRPGRPDGNLGSGTKKEIIKFRTDAALPIGEEINEELLDALGILDFEKYPKATILVVDKNAGYISKKIEKMSSEGILDFLPELYKEDRRSIDLVFSRPKSIIFIIYKPIEEGAFIRTYASNIIKGKRNTWSQSYRYKVEKGTSTGPLIIINEFETGNPMYLFHELYLNEKLVARRVTRAH